MRLWTLHPRYLDAPGLVAAWREGLLAKAVLAGRTKGYRHHPQLERFRSARSPTAAINAYLSGLYAEAALRGYRFERRKLTGALARERLRATRGQLAFEWEHLLKKLRRRSPQLYARLRLLRTPGAHPMFQIVAGPVAAWEKGRR